MWSRLSAVGVANDDLGEQAGDCAAERCAWVPESEHGRGSWKNTQESTHRRPVAVVTFSHVPWGLTDERAPDPDVAKTSCPGAGRARGLHDRRGSTAPEADPRGSGLAARLSRRGILLSPHRLTHPEAPRVEGVQPHQWGRRLV